MRWGSINLRPHFDYRLFYATQVYVRPGEREDTVRHSISPGLLVETPHLALDYTPVLNYYSKGRFEDSVDHNVSFDANALVGDWTFALFHNYAKSSQVLIETARQTETERNSSGVQANYRYSEKTSFDFSLNQTFIDSTDFNSSRQWSTMNWINYHATDSITIGAGVGGGFADVETGSDMTYELIQGKVGWHPGTKLTLDLNGGVEIRQFIDIDDSGNRINPIMGISAVYRIFEQTSLSVQADRSVNTSLLQDRITEDTVFSAALSQRLFGKLKATVMGGFRSSDYVATNVSSPEDRSDETTHVGLTLGTGFLQRGSVSVSYRYLKNSSSQEGFGFTSNQYTFNVGYRF